MCRQLLLVVGYLFTVSGLYFVRGDVHSQKGRVVGGQEVPIEKFPYIISVRVLGAHRCGGSLLRSNVVLTAAHCVDGVHLEFLKFVAGTNSRTKGGVSLRAENVVIHDSYDPDTFQNDIALVGLNGHFEYSTQIQPVILANNREVFREGTRAVITGWGTINEGDHILAPLLRSVDVYGVNFEDCGSIYVDANVVSKGMICTSSPIRGRDSCQGDAGSPLMVGNIQVGIVSWGNGCGKKGYPRVHTEISFYRAWIDSQLQI